MPAPVRARDQVGQNGDPALGYGGVADGAGLAPFLHLQCLFVDDLVSEGLGSEFALQLHAEFHPDEAGAARPAGGGGGADLLVYVCFGQGIELRKEHGIPPLLLSFPVFDFSNSAAKCQGRRSAAGKLFTVTRCSCIMTLRHAAPAARPEPSENKKAERNGE